MHRLIVPASAGAMLLVAGLLPGCSSRAEAQCVKSGESEICYRRNSTASGSVEVNGLKPGSNLVVTSPQTGEATYVVNASGTIDGKVGLLHEAGRSVEVTITGTTSTDQPLVGTFTA